MSASRRLPSDAADARAHRPRLAIIVPVFKHSGLVREAMYSLCAQEDFALTDVVFIDDGCPDPQTHITLAQFARRWDNVHYVRQLNKGLSAARNRGIDFVARALPEAEAIYFLDADNVLMPYSLSAMQAALSAHPDVDWFYPDIRMFGLKKFNDYSGDFNAYAASVNNICEAGSLIRRRMIETGLRFDETMRLGYEDWDFWLSAIERGFRGRHLPSLGLSYRKRAESMLADSGRSDAQIRLYLRSKHRTLFQINRFVALEHDELPRFSVYLSDDAQIEMATDLQRGGRKIGKREFEQRVWKTIREPTFVSVGHSLLTTTRDVMDVLRQGNVLRWITMEIEQALTNHNFVCVTLAASEDSVMGVRRGLAFSKDAHLVATNQNLLHTIATDDTDHWITGLPQNGAEYGVASLTFLLPTKSHAIDKLKNVAVLDFVQFCLHLRCHEMKGRPNNIIDDVFLGSRPLDDMLLRARVQFENSVPPPIAAPQQGRVAFVLPHCDFGGVEKVTFCLARELRSLGFSPSLILIGSETIHRADYAAEAFDDIYIVDYRGKISAWNGESFLGERLPAIHDEQWARGFTNFLSTFELVVSGHSAEILPLLSGLRRNQVTTASYLHLFDKAAVGGFRGHPTLALAYEHAIDLVLTCSDMLAHDMAGLGIPRTKLLPLPNAPALRPAVPPARGGAGGRDGAALRVLYVGRIDPQKGLDRLNAIAESLVGDPGFELRIVGKPVLSNGDAVTAQLRTIIEPPVYDDAGLAEIYAWADVLILPSRYEGLPLTVLEAMAFGVVPIAAECGAVSEAIDHSVSGFVVSQERCVAESLEHLHALAADRARLNRLRDVAIAQVASRTWRGLAQRLVARLETIRAARAAQAKAS
ncbi:glycosyltransferase [Methylobacterium sp. Leaf118]|uniref:glycosyltransferase n=1 Tax=Methylobacterium sp. Leaf118 TaxID=2876562 RepID=UPI001E3B8793|nr:glycosyltransferase [Methylobacterium sp. Leaf118]